MKQVEDTKTIDMLAPAKRGRGRPATGCAMTDAERAKKYRAGRRASGLAVRALYGDEFTRLAQENEKLKRSAQFRDFIGITDYQIALVDAERENEDLKKQIEDLKFQLKGVNFLLRDYQRDFLPPPVPKRRKAGP